MTDSAYAHIMIDCETLGTRPGCHLLSLAAIGFAPATGAMDPEPFEARIGLPAAGDLMIEAGTLRWWLAQSEDARALAFHGNTPIDEALVGFCDYFDRRSAAATQVWAYGVTFDVPIIETAIATHLTVPADSTAPLLPWTYRQPRDARTLLSLFGLRPQHAPGEIAHSPLDDCRAQIRAVCEAWRRLFPPPREPRTADMAALVETAKGVAA